jgi:hypothetical protein
LKRAVLAALAVVGADKDADGQYVLCGEPPCVGIGGDEMVVPPACCYLLGGKQSSLAGLLNATSSGIRNVQVF